MYKKYKKYKNKYKVAGSDIDLTDVPLFVRRFSGIHFLNYFGKYQEKEGTVINIKGNRVLDRNILIIGESHSYGTESDYCPNDSDEYKTTILDDYILKLIEQQEQCIDLFIEWAPLITYKQEGGTRKPQALSISRELWEEKLKEGVINNLRIHRIDGRLLYPSDKTMVSPFCYSRGLDKGIFYYNNTNDLNIVVLVINALRQLTNYNLRDFLTLFINLQINDTVDSQFLDILKILNISYDKKNMELMKEKIRKRFHNTEISKIFQGDFDFFLSNFKTAYMKVRINYETEYYKQTWEDRNFTIHVNMLNIDKFLNFLNLLVCSFMVDIYAILRIFKNFEEDKMSRESSPSLCRTYSYPKNIIFYGGSAHAKVISYFIALITGKWITNPNNTKEYLPGANIRKENTEYQCILLDNDTKFFIES